VWVPWLSGERESRSRKNAADGLLIGERCKFQEKTRLKRDDVGESERAYIMAKMRSKGGEGRRGDGKSSQNQILTLKVPSLRGEKMTSERQTREKKKGKRRRSNWEKGKRGGIEFPPPARLIEKEGNRQKKEGKERGKMIKELCFVRGERA